MSYTITLCLKYIQVQKSDNPNQIVHWNLSYPTIVFFTTHKLKMTVLLEYLTSDVFSIGMAMHNKQFAYFFIIALGFE